MTAAGHSDVRFEPFGERTLKGFAEPIRLHLVSSS